MARTRIKSSDIENLTISAVDIDTNSISNDKIIDIEANKLTGTLLASTFPATLPALDGSALTGELNANRFPAVLPALDGSALSNVSVTSSGIPDNAISLNKLDVSGTTGQFLSIDSSNNLVFDDLSNALSGAGQLSSSNIADNSIGIPQINIADGTTGQVLSRNGSGNLQFIDVVSDPTMGGDLSGVASAASLNNNTVSQDTISPGSIDDSKIIGLDASKLFGTAPFNTVGGGELGFLNKSNWLDEEKVTVSLDNSAPGIGKAVVRVFEEFLDPATQNISSGSDWDITTNDAGFHLYNHASASSVTCTPAAITGTDIEFTFANTSPFTGVDYNDAIGYKITSGPGVARIKSTNGLVATCDIEVDFDNTNTMQPGSFKLESGEFVDGNFTPSSSVSNSIVPFFGLGEDIGGDSEQTDIENGNIKLVSIPGGARAIRLVNRQGSNAFQGQSTQWSVRIIQYDPDSTQGSGVTANQEFFFQSTKSNGRFPVINRNDLSDCDICVLSGRGAVVVGKDANGKCKVIAMHIPGIGSSTITDENNDPQTINIDPSGQTLLTVSDGSCKEMIIKPLSDKHFIVMWSEIINYVGGGSGFVPKLKIGYLQPDGTIVMSGLEKLLFQNDGGGQDGFGSSPGNDASQYTFLGAAGEPNRPILQMFNHESSDARRDFLYLYYRNDGRPFGVHGVIEDFNKNTDSVPTIRYNKGNEIRPNGGHFRDSNNVLLTQTSANNRITTGEYTHWIDAIDQKTAVYFWRDSVLGVQAACVSLGKAGGPPFGNRSIFIGDFFSTGANGNNNITSGPATRLDAVTGTQNAGVGAMSGAIYDQTLRAGYYQWSDHRSGIPVGEAASDVIYGTFIESNTAIIKTTPTNPLTYSVSGSVPSHSVVSMTSNRMFSAHEHGDHNYYARTYNFEQQNYVVGEFIVAISGTDSLDTTNYTEITSVTGIVGGSANGFNSFYAFCTNPTYDVSTGNILTGGTFFISRNGAARRNIATSEASLHGGTEGDWFHNTASGSSENWVRSVFPTSFPQGINKNSSSVALTEALRSNIGENGMTLSNINNDNPFGGTWPALGTTFATALIIEASNVTSPVQIDKLNVIYNAGGLRHRDKTPDYTIDIVDVDTIEVTAPINPDLSGNRNARIFVSS